MYAKCISEEEYHASKRPLLQRLALQGAEIEARDVIVGAQKQTSNDGWSEIDLKDEKWLGNQECKSNSKVKRTRGAPSVFGLVSSDKNGKVKENDANNRSYNTANHSEINGGSDGFKSILMEESFPSAASVMDEKKSGGGKGRKQREQEGGGGGSGLNQAEGREKLRPGKRAWVFDGFKKWRRNDSKDEVAAFSSSVDERPDEEGYGGKLVRNPVGEGPDTRQIKRKLHPNGAPTDFFVDKVSNSYYHVLQLIHSSLA